jgi:hypothetical protein
MEAICWLHLYYSKYNNFDHLCFLATGIVPDQSQLQGLKSTYPQKKIILVLGNDLLGRINDIKIAATIFQKRCLISLTDPEKVVLWYRKKTYQFFEEELTLNIFEKATGLRSGIRTYKPHAHISFLALMLENCKLT